MKLDKKVCVIIFLIFLSGCMHIMDFHKNPNAAKSIENNNVEIEKINNPKVSGSWNIKFIHLKDDNWTENNLDWIQVGAGTKDNPHLIENVTVNGEKLRVPFLIENTTQHFIIKNCTIINSGPDDGWGFPFDPGILFIKVSNGTIFNSTISNNEVGIFFRDSNNNTILECEIKGNVPDDGIHFNNSSLNVIKGNKIHNNQLSGIEFEKYSNNNTIINNTIYSNCVVDAWGDCSVNLGGFYNKVINNTIYSGGMGYGISGAHDIINNTIFNMDDYPAIIIGGNNYKVKNNLIYNCWGGIVAAGSNGFTFNNRISYANYGLRVVTDNSKISENYIVNSTIGIEVINSDTSWNNISGNFLKNCSYGIRSGYWGNSPSRNTFTENIIESCLDYGFNIFSGSYNLIYNNTFNNTLGFNAYDAGTNNYWNSSTIGNVWTNYSSIDADDNGIGDTPYLYIGGSANSKDYLPIFEDADDPPIIIIQSPQNASSWERDAPDFKIKIADRYLNTTWYTLDEGITNYTFVGTTETFNLTAWETIWDILPHEAFINITFYANDSAGNFGWKELTLKKHDPPEIPPTPPAGSPGGGGGGGGGGGSDGEDNIAEMILLIGIIGGVAMVGISVIVILIKKGVIGASRF